MNDVRGDGVGVEECGLTSNRLASSCSGEHGSSLYESALTSKKRVRGGAYSGVRLHLVGEKDGEIEFLRQLLQAS